MRTVINLDLTDDQLNELGLKISGKKHKATRKEVNTWAMKAIQDKLKGRGNGNTELKNMVCPKCNKMIAVQVPVIERIINTTVQNPPAGIEVLKSPTLPPVKLSPELKAMQGTPELAAAVKKAADSLMEMARQMVQEGGQ